ncbi:MAG: hypothetical protein RLZ86_1819 [Actinomycetota bacterium]
MHESAGRHTEHRYRHGDKGTSRDSAHAGVETIDDHGRHSPYTEPDTDPLTTCESLTQKHECGYRRDHRMQSGDESR